MSNRLVAPVALAALLALAACSSAPPVPSISPQQGRAQVAGKLPSWLDDRDGWAADIYAAFAVMGIEPSDDNVCIVLAVTQQESSFRVAPTVPNLAQIAWGEIDAQAERLHIPKTVVRLALRAPSPNGESYARRIDAVTTEHELSEIFEDLIAAVPLGERLFAGHNPIRTGGPMQVSIAWSQRYAEDNPYPYPLDEGVRDAVFTRRGGLFFGIAHLLDYAADYDDLRYRVADFNAGHYASRNAAFQNALTIASGIPLALDGDLIRHDTDRDRPGETETAARALGAQLGLSERRIRRDLEKGAGPDFSDTRLYARVFAQADALRNSPAPRAVVPDIRLESPKITRKLTTEWFVEQVARRHRRCLLDGL